MRVIAVWLAVGLMVVAGCQRWMPCAVVIESTVGAPIEGVRIRLDQMVIVHHAHMSRQTPKHLHIGVREPARVATVQWIEADGTKRQQVLQLAPGEGCTEGRLLLRFVENANGITVEKSVRRGPN